MARIRTIKPEFPQSESMGSISRDARLLFVQMWTLADDSGRLRGNSRMLASLLFPYDDDAPGLVFDWMDELIRQGCIIVYAANDGGTYVEICNWLHHQKIDKPSESKLPSPEDGVILESSRTVAKPREASLPSRARADQGSRIKDQGEDQGPGEDQDSNAAVSQPALPLPDLTKVRYPQFPCVKGKKSDKTVWDCSSDFLERLQETFTAVDAVAEARKAHAWIMAKSDRRKTFGGMEDFLRRWMSRVQDQSGKNAGQKTFADMRVAATKSAIEEFANG